jgi:hypothetical protein
MQFMAGKSIPIFARFVASTLFVFACTCLALGGNDRWWELYTPEEQKKVFAEYDKHLYVAPSPTDRPTPDQRKVQINMEKAIQICTSVKGEESRLVKAYLWYGPKVKEAKGKVNPKKQDESFRHWLNQYTAQKQIFLALCKLSEKTHWQKDLDEKLAHALIDDCITRLKNDTQVALSGDKELAPGSFAKTDGLGVQILGGFGPRADKAYIVIRDWGVATDNALLAKMAMEKIKKK